VEGGGLMLLSLERRRVFGQSSFLLDKLVWQTTKWGVGPLGILMHFSNWPISLTSKHLKWKDEIRIETLDLETTDRPNKISNMMLTL